MHLHLIFVVILFLFHVHPLTATEISTTSFFSKTEWPKTDFSKRSISLDEILSGGPPRDGIPAIDEPIFRSNNIVKPWLKPFEPVISVEINGKAKAYPLQVIMFHEIVNDVLDNQAISVTFCPLCNTSIVFSRVINGKRLDFGTTGRLRNSDLIMYDRQTESWWQQFTGEALIGFYLGTQLKQLNSEIISFQNFQKKYPHGLVLSRDTGFTRPYGKNPYRGYDHIDNVPFLMKGPIDDRLPPMERVLSVTINGHQKLYPFSILNNQSIVQDQINNSSIVIVNTGNIYSALDENIISESKIIPTYSVYSRHVNKKTLQFNTRDKKLFDENTNSQWNVFGKAIKGKLIGQQLNSVNHGIHFAFAWLAFNPDVEIYTTKE